MARTTGTDELLARWTEQIAEDFRPDSATTQPAAVFERAVARVDLISFDVIHSVMRRSRSTKLTRLQGIDLGVGLGDGEDGFRRIFAAILAVRALELLQPSQL